jgi:hypothetical protein
LNTSNNGSLIKQKAATPFFYENHTHLSCITVAGKGKEGGGHGVKSSPPSREIQRPILKHMAELLKMRKEITIETKGNNRRCTMKELVKEHINQFPWLKRDMTNHYINTHHSVNIPIAIDTHHHVVSGITDTSPVNDAFLHSTIATPTEPSCSTTPTEPSCSTTLTKPSQGTSKIGGRPKGTTRATNVALNGISREALDECAIEFATLNTFAIAKSLKDVTGRRC